METASQDNILLLLSPCDQAICEAFLRQNVGGNADESCLPQLVGYINNGEQPDSINKKRFVTIMYRIVLAKEGVSRQETNFLRQIWHQSQANRQVAASH